MGILTDICILNYTLYLHFQKFLTHIEFFLKSFKICYNSEDSNR